MEKTMSVEERIKRAEEIYSRRIGNPRVDNITKVTVNEKKDFKLFRKIILQIITCLLIYCVFYLILSNNSVLSQDFRNKTREVLLYDINFQNIYNIVKEKI